MALVFLAAEFLTGGISQKTQSATGLSQSAVTAAVVGGVLIALVLVMWFPVLNIFLFRRPAIREEVSRWN